MPLLGKGELHEKPFLEHLEDLRGTVFSCLTALGLAIILSFPAAPWILGILKAPLYELGVDPDTFLRSLQVSGAFSVALKTSFWSGLLISTPFLLYFIAMFVFPGLTDREKSVVLRASGFAVGLFILGVVLGYAVTLPVALAVMLKLHVWLGITAEWTINSYVAFTIQLMIGFGLAFELPVIVVVLGKLGIVSAKMLRVHRKHVLVFLLILAMILTPPDVITQMLMAVPLALLYEVCIWIVWTSERGKDDSSSELDRS